MKPILLVALSCSALAACDTMIDPADTAPPHIAVTLLSTGLPPVYHTAPSQTVATASCAPGTSKKSQFNFIPDNLIYVTTGPNAVDMLVSFQDKSGIAEATIKFPVGPIESPEGTTLSTIQHGSQNTGLTVRKYTFTGDADMPKTPHLVSLKHTPSNTNRTYNFTAKDFNGNNRINSFVVIGNQASICE